MMQRVRQPFNVNAPAQWAALAALDDAEHVTRSLAVNRQGLDYLQKEFTRLGLEFVPSQAPISFLCASARGRKFFNDCSLKASSSGRWPAIGFPSMCG